MVFWFPLISWALAILAALIASRVSSTRLVDELLRYILLFPAGIMGLWAFMGHIFEPARSAAAIGWAPSPFQFEVGMANLGIGLAGVIGAFWGTPGFRAAVAVVMVGFLGGAGVGHLVQIAQTGNSAVGNAGPILYTDFLTPLALFALLGIQRAGRIEGRP